ncbi:sensor histidine kinase [Paraherbaspirillum soli]|uniref:histidine kinase n=1 Tax=Paraherbaspirillum soli TaxID=631222 RepID=A0ABW0MAJ1_9BURK
MYQHQVGSRILRIGAPIINHSWILQRMGVDLAVNVLIALPLVLLPLWLAVRRDIELSLEAPDTLLHALDRHAFLSILHNLPHNAVRYIPEGGQVLVELQRSVAANGLLTLAVTDNGPGIPDAEQVLVFERFYRCVGQDVPGSAIVQQAAARLRGTVKLVTPPQSGGCRFVIEIPA